MWRGFLLAVAALMLAGAPSHGAYAQQQKAEAKEAQTAAAQPEDYYRPCSGQEPDRNSDLCAQWKAVDWARSGFFVALAGVIGLVITLAFNFEAWRAARKAEHDTAAALRAAQDNAAAATKLADIAEDTARAELRAYLDFDGVRITRQPMRDVAGSGELAVLATTCVHNYGKTPAENMAITTTNYMSVNGKKVQFTVEDTIDFDSVAPTDHVTHRAYWQMPEGIWKHVEAKKLSLIVAIIVTYTDVFKKTHVLRSEFETLELDEDLGFVHGTRKAT